MVAEAFVRGLICGGSALSSKVNSAGKAVPSEIVPHHPPLHIKTRLSDGCL